MSENNNSNKRRVQQASFPAAATVASQARNYAEWYAETAAPTTNTGVPPLTDTELFEAFSCHNNNSLTAQQLKTRVSNTLYGQTKLAFLGFSNDNQAYLLHRYFELAPQIGMTSIHTNHGFGFDAEIVREQERQSLGSNSGDAYLHAANAAAAAAFVVEPHEAWLDPVIGEGIRVATLGALERKLAAVPPTDNLWLDGPYNEDNNYAAAGKTELVYVRHTVPIPARLVPLLLALLSRHDHKLTALTLWREFVVPHLLSEIYRENWQPLIDYCRAALTWTTTTKTQQKQSAAAAAAAAKEGAATMTHVAPSVAVWLPRPTRVAAPDPYLVAACADLLQRDLPLGGKKRQGRPPARSSSSSKHKNPTTATNNTVAAAPTVRQKKQQLKPPPPPPAAAAAAAATAANQQKPQQQKPRPSGSNPTTAAAPTTNNNANNSKETTDPSIVTAATAVVQAMAAAAVAPGNYKRVEERWNASYQKLLAYQRATGDTDVPVDYRRDPQLGAWCQKQRAMFKRGILRLDRVQWLQNIDFRWTTTHQSRAVLERQARDDKSWQKQYKKLLAYKEKHGDCLVPTPYANDRTLGNWINMQRTLYRQGKIKPERRKLLEEVGFVWKRRKHGSSTPAHRARDDARWQTMYQQLVAYRVSVGDANVPKIYPANKALGTWVQTQRQCRRKGTMSAERIQLLEQLDFVFTVKSNSNNVKET